MSYAVREYLTLDGANPFRLWICTLEPSVSARIRARIFRFEQGNLGDYKSVGGAVFEARVFFDGGYRIYFAFSGPRNLLLLGAGDKRSQRRDVLNAKRRFLDFKQRRK